MNSVPLGEVAEFIRGITFKPHDLVEVGGEGSVGCMRTKNVQALLDTDDVLGIPTRFVKRAEQYLETGDILISSANSWNLLGKCSWVPELPWRSSFGGFVTVLRPHPGAPIDRRFLYRWFSYGRTQQLLRSYGRKTTNISNLPIARCRKMEIPLPPIEEQRRIAAVLDAADDLRTKRRQALAKLDTLTQAIFIDMFGDPRAADVEILGDHAIRVTKGTTPTSVGLEFTRAGIPFIRVQDLVQGIVDGGTTDLYISAATHDALKRSRLLPHDVLLSIAGTIGRVATVAPNAPELNCNQAVAMITAASTLLTEYLASWLVTDHAQEQMIGSRVTGTIANLSLGSIKKLRLPVPTLEAQEAFTNQTRHVREAQALGAQASRQLDTLFASLQQRAFAGEL